MEEMKRLTIKQKCYNPDCRKPNLIHKPWLGIVSCGWCGTEYDLVQEGQEFVLKIRIIKNKHLKGKK